MKRSLLLFMILVISAGIFVYFYYVNRYARPTQQLPYSYTNVKVDMPGEEGGTATPISPGTSERFEVIIKNFTFDPPTLTIKVGDRVSWMNRDSTKHDVTGQDFQSPLLGQGESFIQIFNQAGIFDYYCSPHPSMKGQIIVTEQGEI